MLGELLSQSAWIRRARRQGALVRPELVTRLGLMARLGLMTRRGPLTRRGHFAGVLHLFLGLVLILVLSACGPLPRAFDKASVGNPEAAKLVSGSLRLGVEVEPVQGIDGPLATLLAKSVAKNITRFNIPASSSPFNSGKFVLRGVAVRETDPKIIPHVTIRWQVLDRKGTVISDIVQPLDATAFEWDFGSPRVIKAVGEELGGKVAGLVAGVDNIETASEFPSIGLFVAPVEGAPGDGKVSLTRAITRALKGRGGKLSRKRGSARYILRGNVDVGPPQGGRQAVKLIWIVDHADGRELGRATQANVVPAGIFDGRWGGAANIIAAAAVDGINAVIERAEKGDSGPIAGSALSVPSDLKNSELPVPSGGVLGRISDSGVPPPLPEKEEGKKENKKPGKSAAQKAGTATGKAEPEPGKQTKQTAKPAAKVATSKTPAAKTTSRNAKGTPPERGSLPARPKTPRLEGDTATSPGESKATSPGANKASSRGANTASLPNGDKTPSPKVDKPQALPQVARAPLAFLVSPVEGARGNGNRLLRVAMKKSLLDRDVLVTDDPRQARYRISGSVELVPNGSEKETVRILWTVTNAAGQVLGETEQERDIAKGALDRDWSGVALAAASGALPGIERVLGPRVKPFFRRPKDLGTPPPTPNLPQQPGRALPPPAQ